MESDRGYKGSTSSEIVQISSPDVLNLTNGGNNSTTSENQQIGDEIDVSTEIEELIANSINKKFENGTTTSRRWGQCCIHKVHEKFHKISEHAYVPSIVSIGPFHHGKGSLQAMEECKLSYARSLLTRIARNIGHVDEDTSDWFANEIRGRLIALKQCISVIKKMEREIRECYSDPINLNSEEFVEMVVVDGLFIIELLTSQFMRVYTQNDRLQYNYWLQSSLKWDLLLLENQLPMFVLEHLFNLTAPGRELPEGKCLKVLLLGLFKYPLQLPDANTLLQTHPNCRYARHFLDLIAIALLPTPQCRELDELHSTSGKVGQTMRLKHLIVQSTRGLYSSCRLYTTVLISELKRTAANNNIVMKGTAISTNPPRANNKRDAGSIMTFTPSATELKRAGVQFKRGSTENGFFDIKFNSGVLEIPPILIQDQTELLFRNLIVCEQFSNAYVSYMSSYAIFTNKLITSAEDVELLRRKGIIRNSLGSDENVVNLFNNLSSEIKYPIFYYSQVTSQVNEYYNKRRHIWKATLKREYFNSPWSIISFAAALLLIILTIMAALFAQLSFFVHKS
ncbi:hypothetical protein MKW92_051274 [Papaver armeniacum]|nr:hypothetical protein MKW92_051274 [Papaver armeniacum]